MADALDPEVAAALRRTAVGAQIATALAESVYGGSRDLVGARVRDIAEAERTGELRLVRAAVVELAITAGAWAADLDGRIPPDVPFRHTRGRRARRA